jgi:hypothetical protein
MMCAWAGPAFMISFCIGIWFIAGYVPPVAPAATADQIAAFYQANPERIRIGLLLTMFSATLWIPWAAALSAQMKRMCHSVLSDTQLGCGIATSVFVILPVEVWLAASFRPDRDPALLLFFNDFAFIMFVGLVAPAYVQITSLGIAVLLDVSKIPIFPRWTGYFNIWAALMTLPGGMCVFFKDGPFAWNGLLAFWLPLSVYGVWYPLMFWYLRRAISLQAREGTLCYATEVNFN